MDGLWTVMEGGCPDCNADLKIVSVEGRKEFTEQYTYTGKYKIAVWTAKPVDKFAKKGVVVHECTECGARFETWLGCGGDWVLA